MSDQILLSETRPKASKRYWCDWCTTVIEPGETYYRQTTAHDGTVGTWRECVACDTSQIGRRVGEWTDWREEGAGPNDAYEWATEAITHGTPDDQRAAKKYLERTNYV